MLLRPWKEVLQSIWGVGASAEGSGGESRSPFVRARRLAGSMRSEGEGSLSNVGGLAGGASVVSLELFVKEGVGLPTGGLMGVAVFGAVAVAAL